MFCMLRLRGELLNDNLQFTEHIVDTLFYLNDSLLHDFLLFVFLDIAILDIQNVLGVFDNLYFHARATDADTAVKGTYGTL